MSPNGSVQMSQGLDVLLPKSGPAFPIPCGEWDLLKEQARRFTSEPWFFHTVGSVLIGAALASWITIVVGTYDAESARQAHQIAWVISAACTACGVLALIFAQMQRTGKKQQAGDLVTQMELIEERYERPKV